MATIVILEHALQQHFELPFMVYHFAERWRAAGHTVHRHFGSGEPPKGDLAFVNIDLTVIPPAYRALLSRFPRVVNGAVLDVSKRRYSLDLLDRYADWIGPVILKTDTNYGGRPEGALRAIAKERGLDCDVPDGPVVDGYPVYQSLREVPPEVWGVPGLVVERFLPEREGPDYCVRVWTFFGDRERSVRWIAPDPIVKASNMTRREEVEVPEAIRAWRSRLGFDFGKFDYVRHGERWVLLDVNRTPTYPRAAAGQNPLDALSEGIAQYLR
jgi:hypothetical protein